MQRLIRIATGTASAALLAFACNVRADAADPRELMETLPVTATEPLVVIVKNIIGPIHVTGHDRNTVEMHATETVRGDLQADIERAGAEMQLRTETEPGRVAFRVRNIDGDSGRRNSNWDNYSTAYDIELRVPRGATLEISTVNDGDVTVEDVNGEFDLKNVNGAVRLVRAGGGGRMHHADGGARRGAARRRRGRRHHPPRQRRRRRVVRALSERSDLVPYGQRRGRRDVPREP